MSAWRLIWRSLWQHWRLNAAVALGVAAATAVLTGALLVGASMRGSLRALAIERLGRVEHALVVDRFFRVDLAGELTSNIGSQGSVGQIVPAILLEASLQAPESGRRANPIRGTQRALEDPRLDCDAGGISPAPTHRQSNHRSTGSLTEKFRTHHGTLPMHRA